MKSNVLNKYGEILLLWFLCTVCTSAATYIYINTIINIWSVIGAIISAAVILFADFARKKKFGGLLYTAVFVCISFIPAFVIRGRYEITEFVRWFFSGSEAVETKTSFIFVLTVMVSFLFTSAAYYFTKVIYRSSVITLITLIPFALAVKTAVGLPVGYTIAASSANIIFFVYYSRKNIIEGAVVKGKSAFVVYTDYAVAVILLALLIPKPASTPYYEKFEELTSRFQIGGTSESSFTGEYKNYSGVTDDLRRGESVLIYVVNTSSPVYMKTQVFDIYNQESGIWTEADKMMGSKNWQTTAPLLSYEKLGDAAEKYSENADFVRHYDISESETFATVYTNDFPAVYVLAPLRATKLILSNVNATYNARTKDGEIFTNNRHMPQNANYTIRYYKEDVFDRLIANGACDTTAEKFGIELAKLYDYTEKGTDDYNVAKQFYQMHNSAVKYAEATRTAVSSEIQALADEITAGLEYDYQKAEAIEQYFQNNGFVYDLAYEAPEESDTPEYFLFESKRGICSDYATAYTLIARAAGLTVRYVEGFVMQDSKTTPGMYFIYTDNAHAYPEVYIPGAGWMVYEPTPSSIIAAGEDNNVEDERTDPLAFVFTAIIAVAVIGIFIALMLLMPKIIEAVFRFKIRFSDGSKAVILIYNRHAVHIERKTGSSCKSLTPEQLSARTEKLTGISLEPLVTPFVKACYGGAEIDKKEKDEAFECYKIQHRAIHRIKKGKD